MNLSEWREQRRQTVDVVLPSGLTVQLLKRVSILDVVWQGDVPQTLATQFDGLVQAAQKGGGVVSVAQAREFRPLVDLVCQAALAGPEGLAVDELPAEDRLFIFTQVNQEAQALAPFRAEAGESVASASNGTGVRAKAQRVPRSGAG